MFSLLSTPESLLCFSAKDELIAATDEDLQIKAFADVRRCMELLSLTLSESICHECNQKVTNAPQNFALQRLQEAVANLEVVQRLVVVSPIKPLRFPYVTKCVFIIEEQESVDDNENRVFISCLQETCGLSFVEISRNTSNGSMKLHIKSVSPETNKGIISYLVGHRIQGIEDLNEEFIIHDKKAILQTLEILSIDQRMPGIVQDICDELREQLSHG